MKSTLLLLSSTVFLSLFIYEKYKNNKNEEKLDITNEWDKTFNLSEKVTHKKVTFHNRYGITLVGDLYEPKIKLENYQLLQYVAHLVQLKNNHQDYMQ